MTPRIEVWFIADCKKLASQGSKRRRKYSGISEPDGVNALTKWESQAKSSADIYFNAGDPNTTFTTPAALGAHPKSYDLESILTHEFGHFPGFGHFAVGNAMMSPYARIPGT